MAAKVSKIEIVDGVEYRVFDDGRKMRLCGARYADGNLCKRFAVRGATRCQRHGGRTPTGPLSPRYTHGGYSKYLPAGLVRQYETATTDPDLLSMKADLGLIQVRVNQLVARLDEGGSERWAKLAQTYAAFKAANRAKDAEAQLAALTRLDEIITRGQKDEETWADLLDILNQRSDLAVREHRRQVDLQTMMSADEARAMFIAIVEAVNANVTDPQARTAIARDIGRIPLLGIGGPHRPAPGVVDARDAQGA